MLLTYNPSGHSFHHWLTAPPAGIAAVKALAGVLLLIGWMFCLRTAYVALGRIGLIPGAALLGSCVRLLFEVQLIDVDSPSAMTWLVLAIIGVPLGIGLSWSLIRARTTGQVEVQSPRRTPPAPYAPVPPTGVRSRVSAIPFVRPSGPAAATARQGQA